MKVVHHQNQTPSEVSPQVEGEDILSSMPEDVFTNIMNRLPLRDAVRTSILSTSWRFKWTLLTQLIFDPNFFKYLRRGKTHFDESNIYSYYTSRLLFHLGGGVTKFVLDISFVIYIDDKDIRDWVMFLSRIRGFKEFTLLNWHLTPVKLPTQLFSCLDLEHLTLYSCFLSPLPYFRGFPKLLSLDMSDVRFHDHRFGELIAQCPLLETLAIFNYELREEVNLVEIAKLKNLKALTLTLCLLDNMSTVRLSTVLQHLSLLPKLQELILSFINVKFSQEDVAQSPVCTNFPFLKELILYDIDFSSHSMLSCAFGMLFGCRNLQTLRIRATDKEADREPGIEVDCNMIGQMQLRSVALESIKGNENELCLIKSILASSPFLKEISVHLSSSLISDGGDVKFVNQLLKFPRASPTAVIAV